MAQPRELSSGRAPKERDGHADDLACDEKKVKGVVAFSGGAAVADTKGMCSWGILLQKNRYSSSEHASRTGEQIISKSIPQELALGAVTRHGVTRT